MNKINFIINKKSPAARYFCPNGLSSPLQCLTSVFGMGTGVSTALSPPDYFFRALCSLKTRYYHIDLTN